MRRPRCAMGQGVCLCICVTRPAAGYIHGFPPSRSTQVLPVRSTHANSLRQPAWVPYKQGATVGGARLAAGRNVRQQSIRRSTALRMSITPESVLALTSNLSSLLVLTLVVAVHEAGHFLAARLQGIKVKNFSIGLGPKLLSYGSYSEEDGGVEYTLRAIPVGGFVSFPKHLEEQEDGTWTELEDPDLLQNRPLGQRALVVAAGVVANLALSWMCIFGLVSSLGMYRPHYSSGVVITALAEAAGPAATAGLQRDDVVLAINGNELKPGMSSLQRAVGLIKSSDSGQVDVLLSRNGRLQDKTVQARLDPASQQYSIGVRLAPNVDRVDHVVPKNPLQAAQMTMEETGQLVAGTFDSLRQFFTTGDTEAISGPVGVVKKGADMARADGAVALLQFAAVISINLAVINSLPIPGLDGGQMVFLLIELLEGKKMKRSMAEVINGVALLILFMLSVSTIVGDLGGLSLFERFVAGSLSFR